MSTNNEKIEAQRAAFLHQPIQHWHRHLIGPSELELLLARAHTDHTAEYWMGVATRRGEELAQATKECDALRAANRAAIKHEGGDPMGFISQSIADVRAQAGKGES